MHSSENDIINARRSSKTNVRCLDV